MARITFQKRQKEMKRLEKQRTKAERREQRKLEKRAQSGSGAPIEGIELEAPLTDADAPPVHQDQDPQP